MIVRDTMETDVETIYLDASVAEAARRMMEADVGSLVVTKEDGDLVGIVTVKDLTVGCLGPGHRPWECMVYRHMSFPLVTVGPDAGLEEALEVMLANGVRHLPVVDGHQLVGLIGLTDVLKAMHAHGDTTLTPLSQVYKSA